MGQGGFGFVFKNRDSSNALTAIKLIFPAEEKDNKKTLRECKIGCDLEPHPNIVQILNYTKTTFTSQELRNVLSVLPNDTKTLSRKLAYIDIAEKSNSIQTIVVQMELCGEDLRRWLILTAGKSTDYCDLLPKQIAIIKNLTAGLTYLHENKIIHRDLKPSLYK